MGGLLTPGALTPGSGSDYYRIEMRIMDVDGSNDSGSMLDMVN